MTQNIKHGYKALLAEANSEVETLTVAQAQAALGSGNAVMVDLRDPRELERNGRIPGSFSCPRGMLEFWIDPESPSAKPIFQEDRKVIFQCASGWRSALAAKPAQDMGLKPVAHLGGGFTAWCDAGGAVEQVAPRHKATG